MSSPNTVGNCTICNQPWQSGHTCTQPSSSVSTDNLLNKLATDFARLDRKYGKDWTEWQDVRDDINTLRLVAIGSKEQQWLNNYFSPTGPISMRSDAMYLLAKPYYRPYLEELLKSFTTSLTPTTEQSKGDKS